MKLLRLLLLGCVLPSLCFAQGDLNPPGTPAPTMKSLDQIEARTPISSAPITISVSGSYYLTANLGVTGGDAVTISADNVTIDLGGFSISSTAAAPAGSGILLTSGRRNITIQNGFINGTVTESGGTFSGGGFNSGISYSGSLPFNVLVSRVSVSACKINGINLGAGSQNTATAEFCTANVIGVAGITANDVSHSSAYDCGGNGIIATTAMDCYGETNGAGSGINAVSATNCRGRADSPGNSTGITATTAMNCYGTGGNSQGINAVTATNCWGLSNASQGIAAETATNCYGESNGNRGIFANVAMGCSGTSHGVSYGLFATSIANTCYGFSQTGTGLNANIAIGCIGVNGVGGSAISYVSHYNMPPSPVTP
ncbi:MAG: hypothetical protein M3R59_01605 [Verrucomicrobiota bacterium]|nr:hypothetical protein [Verrucomicrobiota bacterium]